MTNAPKFVMLALLGATVTGCAEIGFQTPVATDKLIRTIQSDTDNGGAVVEVKQTGTTVRLRVSDACDSQESQIVERTTVREAKNNSSTLDWTLAVLSGAAVGTGFGLVANAKRVYPNDDNSRLYNPTGPDSARVYGYTFIAVGAALLAVPIVDAIRANQSQTEVDRLTVPSRDISMGHACPRRRLSAAAVSTVLTEAIPLLGRTDKYGRLSVDLDRVIDVDAVLPATQETIPILVNGKALGALEIGPLRALREERAGAKTGAVAFPQRFGGSLNLNVHFHVVFLDCVFAKNTDGNLAFHPLQAPSQTEIATLVADIGSCVKNLLRRRDLLRNKPVDAENRPGSAGGQ